MPLGIERLNARHQQPNSRIVFIKPLPGPTAAFAQDFLERIAAICHPIMKAHHVSIMSLEEYEPNPEFVGRNFNAGEVIQLVLRAQRTGHWLGFRSVQMVMMHELAHCKQMNHSGAFWAVRNQFADELRKLWEQNYTGDGFWGRGKTLLSGRYEPVSGLSAEIVPRSLCGGTFRSWRGRKRKRKGEGKVDGTIKGERLSYAERQQRRIAKKFGTHGVKLGDDTETRVKLEDGKKPRGNPRVAGSARGRELRAAAALARLSGQKQEEEDLKAEEPDEIDSETESEEGDIKTVQLPNRHGKGIMIKVCEDEDKADIRVKQEMEELQDLNSVDLYPKATSTSPSPSPQHLPSYDLNNTNRLVKVEEKSSPPLPPSSVQASDNITKEIQPTTTTTTTTTITTNVDTPRPLNQATLSLINCPICSLANPSPSIICAACGHVLDRDAHRNHWRCASAACRESAYLNSEDYWLCRVCGARRVGNIMNE